MRRSPLLLSACALLVLVGPTIAQDVTKPPQGFTALFDGKTLNGWFGLGHANPYTELATPEAIDRNRKKNHDAFVKHWTIQNGELVNDGNGPYATSDRQLTDYEFLIDYKTVAKADSGIYLKATPQVQIWDFTRAGGKWNLGADKGSGGLWNNSAGAPGKDPLVLADKAFGEWNSFRIRQIGARTNVILNAKLVVDNAILENFWDRKKPLLAKGPIQLQTHGGEIRWRNIFVRDIPAEEANSILDRRDDKGFVSIFDGKTLDGWAGAVKSYEVVEGAIRCKKGQGGVLHTKEEYGDFVVRLEIRIPRGGNNGLAIRYPGKGDPAYSGMCELQVLDSEDKKYAGLDARQYHGSAYGMVAAHRGYLRPADTWNFQEVTVKGSKIKVELNGNIILDTDLSTVKQFMANSPHPGKDLARGFFGFAGHSDPVEFRNIRIKKLDGTGTTAQPEKP